MKETEYYREGARAILKGYLDSFIADDTLESEQADITEALSEPEFPSCYEEYVDFCEIVLGHIPGEDDE